MPQYRPEQWRLSDEYLDSPGRSLFTQPQPVRTTPDAQDQSRLLHLLGSINYQILTGNKVYIEVDGVVYKTLYGAYWRSVFTGIEHYLIKCEELSSMWTDGGGASPVVEMPIVYANGCWSAGGYSLSFMIHRDVESMKI